jgi:AbrB family looped-hinge helix DNA binding protein
MEIRRLSARGQIVLPKNIRDSRGWGPGTEFTVEETCEGVLLRPAARFPVTSLDEVVGYLRSKGKAKTPRQKDSAIDWELTRRYV